MEPKPRRIARYLGPIARKHPRKYTINLAGWQADLLHQRVEALGLRGPSEFIQRLMSEAIGVGLPCVRGGER